MTSVERRMVRARHLSDGILRVASTELRHARIQAGLSQRSVADAAGTSRAEVSRIERAAAPRVTVEALCRVAVVLGLAPSLRLFPDGVRLRDAASVRVLGSLRKELHPSIGWSTEVPLAAADRRAWDAVLTGRDWRVAVECETRLFDVQALERRIALKRRDDGSPDVLLLVPRTRTNREAMTVAGDRMRSAFPLETRAVLAALRAGLRPGGSGIVLL